MEIQIKKIIDDMTEIIKEMYKEMRMIPVFQECKDS